MSNRTYLAALLGITLAAWALRLAVTERFVGLASAPARADGLDQLDYELFAYRMSSGAGYTLESGQPTARRAPGTSLVILPVYWLWGRSYLAARVWMTFLSALTCWAAAWVVRRSCGPGVALLTAIGVALNPGLFYYGIHLWSEVPFCLFSTLATGFAVRAWNDGRWTDRLAAGACWGAALLIRPQVVFLTPFVGLAVLWSRGDLRRRILLEAAVQAGVVAAIATPWVTRNAIVMGKPTLATVIGGYTFWGAHNDRTFHDPRVRGLWIGASEIPGGPYPVAASELEEDAITWRLGWDSVQKNAAHLPQLLLWKLYRFVTPFEETPNRMVYWTFALAWSLTLPLLAAGCCELYRRDPALWQMICLQICGTVLCVLLFYGAARFRHALEPLLMMAAAVGLTAVWSDCRNALRGLAQGKPEVRRGGAAEYSPRLQV